VIGGGCARLKVVLGRGTRFFGLPSTDAMLLSEAGREWVGEAGVLGCAVIGLVCSGAASLDSVDVCSSSVAEVAGAGDAACRRRTEPMIESGI
jgi:hypothetical protein